MTIEDYRDAWRDGEGERAPPEPDGRELLGRVEERSAAFDRKIRRRDLVETLAAAFVAALFGYEIATATSWLSRAGAAVLVLASGFVVWRLRRARAVEPDGDPSRPIVARLRAERDKVDAQIRLLESILWWYLTPLGVGVVLFTAGLDAGPWQFAVYAGVVLGYSWIYWLNQRVVRRRLRPHRRELTRRLEELDETEPKGSLR